MKKLVLVLFATVLAGAASAQQGFVFPSTHGGNLRIDARSGRPVLVVNTAARSAFTPRRLCLQAHCGRYRDSGLVALADDISQEPEAEVKASRELAYGLGRR